MHRVTACRFIYKLKIQQKVLLNKSFKRKAFYYLKNKNKIEIIKYIIDYENIIRSRVRIFIHKSRITSNFCKILSENIINIKIMKKNKLIEKNEIIKKNELIKLNPKKKDLKPRIIFLFNISTKCIFLTQRGS